MITIKDFMEVCNYRITEGSDYMWQCYGPKAYCLDSWNGDQDGHTVSIVFDTETQTVYEALVYDYRNERAYRMINPDFKAAHEAECEDRDVKDEAWQRDDGSSVRYIDLEVEDDWIQKALAIVAGEDYDTRVSIPLDLDKETVYEFMLLAHQKDMTLNELVEEAIKNAMEELEKDPEGFKARAERWKNEKGIL